MSLPYTYAKGARVHLPKGVAHGMLFQLGRKVYVAVRYTTKTGARLEYGVPVKLNRK